MGEKHLTMQQIPHPTLFRLITNYPGLFVSMLLLFCSGVLYGQEPFVIVVQTDNPGISGNNQFTIPTNDSYRYDYQVDWTYDGGTFNAESRNVVGDIVHTYERPGQYIVAIQGQFPGIFFKEDPAQTSRTSDAQKLIDILQWGEIEWADMSFSFAGCINLGGTATDSPNLDHVASLESTFSACTSLTLDVEDWNVREVTQFHSTFLGASLFNQDLGDWDLRNATNMANFLDGTGMDQGNYDATLQGWSTQFLPSGLTVGVDNLTYCNGEVARKILIDSLNWTFVGDLKDCPFVFVVKTDNPGDFTSDTEYKIPTSASGLYDYQVDWTYDGITFNVEDDNVSGSITHDYGIPGTYTIAIRGVFEHMYNNIPIENADPEKLIEVQQWGSIEWGSMLSAFYGCTDMILTAEDIPDLSQVSNLINTFRSCTSFTGHSSMKYWEVGGITSFNLTFAVSAFNQDISAWDVSAATNFSSTFTGNTAFNQDISGWNTSACTNFRSMFSGATAFDQNLGNWDITNATNIENFLDLSGLSVANYDATLIGWAAQPPPSGLTFSAFGLAYCNGETARNTLINTYGWTITGDQLDCSALNECPDDRIVTQADITADITLRAGSTLETDGTVTITAGQNVTFTAGQTITLKPGFTAEAPFRALIEDCPPMMAAADEQIATEDPASTFADLPSGKKQPIAGLQVFPNPTYDRTTLRFDLREPGTASLTLHALKGETLRTLLRGHRLDAGRQEINLRTADLPPGLYLARLQTTQGVQTAKVVVARN